MNFVDFHAAVGKIANGTYFSACVDVSTHPDGETVVEWKAYVRMRWFEAATPEACLLLLVSPPASANCVGPVPESTAALPPATEEKLEDDIPW